MTSKKWYLDKYSPSLIEAIATHYLLNELGFSSENEIFVIFAPKDIIVELRSGGKEIQFRVGIPELDPDDMAVMWKVFINDWNTGGIISKEEKDKIFFSSKASQIKPVIVAGIENVGIKMKQ